MKENLEYSDSYDQYLKNHERRRQEDEYLNTHWEKASKQIGKDEFNEQIQIVPTKRKKNWHRPNIFKAARECQQTHGYRIHTLQFGSSNIAEGCMRFIAMLGRGTALKSNQNTLVDQLVSIYCSADKELFEKYQNSLDSEALDSIAPLSTFILR